MTATASPIESTTREQQVFDYIVEHLEAHGFQPSVREIAAHLRFASTKTVADLLLSMQAKGMVRLGNGRSRGVELLGVKVTVTRQQEAAQ